MNKSIFPTLAFVLVTILAIGGMVQYARSNNGSTEPVFSFDDSKASGWWSSGNSNQQSVAGNNYSGKEPKDKLPTADIAVHHVTADKVAQKDSCFVLFSYYKYRYDNIGSAYKEYEDKKSEHDDKAKLETIKTSQQSLTTHEGDIFFELRDYNLSVPGSDILSGYQVGFANTDKGHIRIEGVCKSAQDLTLTIPVIDATSLKK